MHKLMARILSLTFLIVFSTSLFAGVKANGRFTAESDAPTILFVNGIRNDVGKAMHSSQALIDMYTASGRIPPGRYNHDFLYNQKDGPAGIFDVAELVFQTSVADQFRGDQIGLGAFYNEKYAKLPPVPEDNAIYRIVKFSGQLRDHIKSILSRSSALIIVPHSQGNLYVEAAYAMLLAEGASGTAARVRVIGVANTAQTTPSNRYITHVADTAIGISLPAATVPKTYKAMSWNEIPCYGSCPPSLLNWAAFWTSIFQIPDLANHSFADIYLSEKLKSLDTSRSFAQVIYDHLDAALKELQPLLDNFDGPTVDSTKWNSTGQATISAGHLNLGVLSSINTKGKFTFTAPKLVIEFRASSSGAVPGLGIALLEVANTANRIYVQDTAYGGFGFLGVGQGAFASSQLNLGNHTANELEYRVTIEGSKMTIERGTTLSNISLSGVVNLGASIAGRSLYLDLGTNQQTSSSFDWIRVGPEPTVSPPTTWPTSCKAKNTVLGSWTTFGTTTWSSTTNTYSVGDKIVYDPNDSDGDCNQVDIWRPGTPDQDSDWLIHNQIAPADVDFAADACISFSPLSGHYIGLYKADPAFTNQAKGGHTPLLEALASFFTMWNKPGQLMYSIEGVVGNIYSVPLTVNGYCANYRLTRAGSLYSLYVNGSLVKSATAAIAPVYPTVMAYDNVVSIKPTVKID